MDQKRVAVPLAATLAVQSLVSMAAVTVPVFALTASADIGISATYIGIYVGLIYAASTVSSLLFGGIIIKYGALRVSQLCLILSGIGLSLVTAEYIPVLVISALTMGMGYGPTTPASSHILIHNTPSRLMSFIFSLKQTGVPLGGAMAGAIVPTLVVFAGWKFAAIIVSLFCFVLAWAIQPVQKGLDQDRQVDHAITFKGIFQPLILVVSHRHLLQMAIISIFFSGMQIGLVTYLVLYLTKHVGMTLIAAGLFLSTGQIAGTIGRIFWGIIADRYVKPRLLVGLLGICMSLGGILTASFNNTWPYAAIFAVIVFFGATAIGWNGVFLAEVARLAPEGKAGLATGGTLFFTYLGVVAGPPIFAAVINATNSYSIAFFAFAALSFISGAIAILSSRKT